jgi:hypothetical protein
MTLNIYRFLISPLFYFMSTRNCLILILTFIGFSAKAQIKPFSFGFYGEAMFRTAALKERTNNGFGGGLDFQFRLPVKLVAIGSAGFIHFDEKKLTTATGSPELNIVTLRAGVKYRINLLYIKVESGATLPLKNEESATILSPGLGIKFSSFDLQAKYEIWLDEVNQEFYGIKLGIFF